MLLLSTARRSKQKLLNNITKKWFSDSVKKEGIVQGPGVKAGSIGSDWEHAVGVERLELLGKLAGKPVFSSSEPLRHAKGDAFKGTLAEPIMVESLAGPGDAVAVKERIVGCSGVPRGSHEIGYFWVRSEKEATRCPECGQAFKLNLLMSH